MNINYSQWLWREPFGLFVIVLVEVFSTIVVQTAGTSPLVRLVRFQPDHFSDKYFV